MEAQTLNLSILTLPLLLLFHRVPIVRSADGLHAGVSNAAAAYISSSCASTIYPDVCYNTLSRYAGKVRNDPGRLASVAISVSLSMARQIAAYLSKANHASEPRTAAALRDCVTNFGDAIDGIKDSLNQMSALDTSRKESFRFQMSNVQTWMSAALTDQVTCMDGFEDVLDSPLKLDVHSRVSSVKQVTSNALTLVNSYVNQVAP